MLWYGIGSLTAMFHLLPMLFSKLNFLLQEVLSALHKQDIFEMGGVLKMKITERVW